MASRYQRGVGRRVGNAVVRALLALGLGPRSTYLLGVVGRRSGTLRYLDAFRAEAPRHPVFALAGPPS